MNFFESQRQATAQTSKLILLFACAVLSLIIITNLLVMGVFGYLDMQFYQQPLSFELIKQQFDWDSFLIIGAIVLSVVIVGSLFKASELSGGGRTVANALGGTLIAPNTSDHQYALVLNVVEEMAIASGTPVPPVYVLKNESGINAFAAGFSTDDAVIGVTQGAIDYFTRDELQGVIAHEFSHIIHGDMRLNMRLVSILHGILVIGLIGYHILDGTRFRSRSKEGNQIALLGMGLMVVGYTGTFFGNMIKASVSRQREYLADASAVQFTRNNRGVAEALKKIGGFTEGSTLSSPEAASFSHAFFSKALSSKWQSIFSTHPPLKDRIKRIDPSFRGQFPVVMPLTPTPASEAAPNTSDKRKSEADNKKEKVLQHLGILASVGQLDDAHIENARGLLAGIPSKIKAYLYAPQSVSNAIYALFLSANKSGELIEEQRQYLASVLRSEAMDEVSICLEAFKRLGCEYRLPIIEISLPQLKQMSKAEYVRFERILNALMRMDGHIDITEWSLNCIISRYLKRHFELADVPQVKYRRLQQVKPQLRTLVAQLAFEFVEHSLHKSVLEEVQSKFNVDGLSSVYTKSSDIQAFNISIERLQFLAPKLKETVLALCIFLVSRDKDFSVQEQETIRAIAEALGCPIPLIKTL